MRKSSGNAEALVISATSSIGTPDPETDRISDTYGTVPITAKAAPRFVVGIRCTVRRRNTPRVKHYFPIIGYETAIGASESNREMGAQMDGQSGISEVQ